MKTSAENKMQHADGGCACTDCRVRAAGLGPGPYTPAEYALIAAPVVLSSAPRVGDDPVVKSADRAAERAQAEYERLHDQWVAKVAEARSAELVAMRQPMIITHTGTALYPDDAGAKVERGRELDEAANELRGQRERAHRAWRQAVAARDEVVRRARWRAEGAE